MSRARKNSPRPQAAPALGRNKALLPEARTYECARCSRTHNGASTPPGWGFEAGQGLLCDDCDNQLRLAAVTGTPVYKRAAA